MDAETRLAWAAVWVCILPLACVDPNTTNLTSPKGEESERSSAALSLSQTLLDAFAASLQNDLLLPYNPTAHDGSYSGFVEDRGGTWGLQQDGDKFLAAQGSHTLVIANREDGVKLDKLYVPPCFSPTRPALLPARDRNSA